MPFMLRPEGKVILMPSELRSHSRRLRPVPRCWVAKQLKLHRSKRFRNLPRWCAHWPTLLEPGDRSQRPQQSPRPSLEVLEATNADPAEVRHERSSLADVGNVASTDIIATSAPSRCAFWTKTAILHQDTRARSRRLSILERPIKPPRIRRR